MSFHHKTMNVLDLKYEPFNTEECVPIYALVSVDFEIMTLVCQFDNADF